MRQNVAVFDLETNIIEALDPNASWFAEPGDINRILKIQNQDGPQLTWRPRSWDKCVVIFAIFHGQDACSRDSKARHFKLEWGGGRRLRDWRYALGSVGWVLGLLSEYAADQNDREYECCGPFHSGPVGLMAEL